MASKKAKRWLASIGVALDQPHNATERSNFATGRGSNLPYHIVRMDSRYGDSKKTVGWADTLTDAREQVANLRADTSGYVDAASGGAEHMRNRYFTFYIRDVRTDRVYR